AHAEGLNFAIFVEDVQNFLRSSPLASVPRSSCKTVKLFDGRNSKNNGYVIQYDTNCDGRVDFVISAPDNAKEPWQALIDSNFDGKVDITVDDDDHDGRWDISFHDVDFDGIIDLIGYHPDGKLKASRFERYVASR